MNDNNEKSSFMDRNTILAIVIVMAFWFGWSKYIEKKYPQPTTPPETVTATQVAREAKASPEKQNTVGQEAQIAKADTSGATAQKPEQFLSFEDSRWALLISSKGMGLKDINIKDYQTREKQPVLLGKTPAPYTFSTQLVGVAGELDFSLQQTEPGVFKGTAQVGAMTLEKTIKLDSSRYAIETEIWARNTDAAFAGVQTTLSEVHMPSQGNSLFAPASDHQDFFVVHDGTNTRHLMQPGKSMSFAEKNIEVAALSTHYFTAAHLDRSDILPRFKAENAGASKFLTALLIYEPINKSDTFHVRYTSYAGPKSYQILSTIDEKMTKIIDYGMFAFIAKPLLWLMKYLFSMFQNYGVAIIILTILVRLIVMPFNVYSYRSMKVMQVLQPKMQALREKYKSDPQTMNREVMALMKAHKANPLGGCLPMLLQLPVFFALYQVLGQSIELYRAPFALWIHDLSYKDPYYVLPVLMGITMFIQQKITPTTMDPQQAKILMFMPIIFSLLMLSLPSGLTLYIFISTLFGIGQQYFFMRDKTSNVTVKEAGAPAVGGTK